ncbi:hypothetical protein MLD38_020094 [Melastoma candidum]|uniref:Uncharacterized protein n=1 Tax=Melastoma candidum TaxID=119954 RepID=A0ACB9QEU3_9MYRT|nr:hypothetical protein MLD38_020094 [Melastoma candidum]
MKSLLRARTTYSQLNSFNNHVSFIPVLSPLVAPLHNSPPFYCYIHRNKAFPSFTTVSSLEKQFEEFRSQLEESVAFREMIRSVVMEIESTARLMHSNLLMVHQSRLLPELLSYLEEQRFWRKHVFWERHGKYYRYHGDWRSETQNLVFLVTFMHWLETGDLILDDEAADLLGCMDRHFLRSAECLAFG